VWRFHLGELPAIPIAAEYDDRGWEIVSLPHSHVLFPASLAGFRQQGRAVGWYRRGLEIPADWAGKKLFVEFQGAMQVTTLWANGVEAGEYAVSGFDSFHFDITSLVKPGKNVLVVRVDNRVNRDIPPDGVPMDFILFGGLYRDVFLHVTDPLHLSFPWEQKDAGVRVTITSASREAAVLKVDVEVRNESGDARQCTLVNEVRDSEGKLVHQSATRREIPARSRAVFSHTTDAIIKPHLWSPQDPYLYQVHTFIREGEVTRDHLQTPLGIRWVKFDREHGFSLNGEPMKLVGANRHQTWPFIGQAVPNGLHRRDAEQLKAMGVNWVRLSHYPQDPDFLDALDELGLMATAEPPTWMNAGPQKWTENLEASFRSMIRRDRNHPCIILWNTCINHQGAEPRLVAAAREEDPTRERGQDTVPTPMNFHPGEISGGGALATEHTGHTFPCARGMRAVPVRVQGAGQVDGDTRVNREYEQAQRHWEQVNAAYLKRDNSGVAVWCMYDYNTEHNVNEPGVACHGVCDMFRIPKFGYYWHQSELTAAPMAYIVRIDASHTAVFSNGEQVRFSQDLGRGYELAAMQKPDRAFTNRLGQRMEYALHHPPLHFGISTNAIRLKAEALVDNVVRASYEWRRPGMPAAVRLEADRPVITADGADLSRVIVTAVDAEGVPVEQCQEKVTFTITGVGQFIGENPAPLRAGKAIILVQSGFVPDELSIAASAGGLQSGTVVLRTTKVGVDVDLPRDLPAKMPTQRKITGLGTALGVR
jgi:beta-galactosidase